MLEFWKIIPHSIVTPLFDEFNNLVNQHYDSVIKYLSDEIPRDKIEIIVNRLLEILKNGNKSVIQGLYIALCLIFDNDESLIIPLICRITEEQFS